MLPKNLTIGARTDSEFLGTSKILELTFSIVDFLWRTSNQIYNHSINSLAVVTYCHSWLEEISGVFSNLQYNVQHRVILLYYKYFSFYHYVWTSEALFQQADEFLPSQKVTKIGWNLCGSHHMLFFTDYFLWLQFSVKLYIFFSGRNLATEVQETTSRIQNFTSNNFKDVSINWHDMT